MEVELKNFSGSIPMLADSLNFEPMSAQLGYKVVLNNRYSHLHTDMRVIRGPDWTYGNDGGNYNLGTIIAIDGDKVKVLWDSSPNSDPIWYSCPSNRSNNNSIRREIHTTCFKFTRRNYFFHM
jgi:hypothetical protein